MDFYNITTPLGQHCNGIPPIWPVEQNLSAKATAIRLYQKYGFIEIPLDQGLYERADIKMKKEL